jgi:hypothetical protein
MNSDRLAGNGVSRSGETSIRDYSYEQMSRE